MKPLHILTLSLLLPLAGCQYSNYVYETPNDEPWSIPPRGTVVVLNQPIAFRPGTSRSYIQAGEARTSGEVNRYEPWCQFYLYESKDAMKHERSIQPDEFVVQRASQGIGFVMAQPVSVAAIAIGGGIGVPFHTAVDDVGSQTLSTTMRIKSEKQPQVRELQCSTTDDALRQNFVSINRIQATLGEVVTLRMPSTK